jgi:peptide subunit release factor 1 (eRF1)
MKLLRREQLEALSKFRSEDFLTVSFFLDSDRSRLTKKEIVLSAKNLLNTGRLRLEELDLSKGKKESLSQDLEKISSFFSRSLGSSPSPGIAVFSCAAKNFWQDFSLPDAPRDRIIFDKNSYIRPLSAILDEYRHIFAFLIDRREAKWYEVLMGEIALLESLSSNVPSKVREGGWEGYESKRIERHITAHLHDHFKRAAKTAFDLFQKNRFEWLFLGCKEEYCSEFEPFLHPYLRDRLKARIKGKPGDAPDKVLKECLELERKLKTEEEKAVAHKLVSALEKGELAVSGIKDTLRSLNQGGVQTLIVTRNFSKPGRMCVRCQLLFLDELRCPSCQKKTDSVQDVIDEAVEKAMDRNCQVRHITAPSGIDRYGKIGAFLRFKT